MLPFDLNKFLDSNNYVIFAFVDNRDRITLIFKIYEDYKHSSSVK